MQDHNAASYMRSWVHAPFFYYDGDSPYDGAGFSYFWIGLIFLDMQSLPNKYALNLNRGIVSTPFGSGFTDAGYSYYLLEYTKDLNPKPIHRLCFKDVICENCKKNNAESCTHNTQFLQQLGVSEKHIPLLQEIPFDRRPKHIDIGIELFDSGTFFHYRSGSKTPHGPSKKFAAKKNIAFNNLSKTILEE